MLSAEERAALIKRAGPDVYDAMRNYGWAKAFAEKTKVAPALRDLAEAEDALLLAIDRLREAHRG